MMTQTPKIQPPKLQTPPTDVTALLRAWREGDSGAKDDLFQAVYGELRVLARRYMRRERGGHTLQTTALVNEAYLRLTGADLSWQDRGHFFAVAARLMRRVLVEYARERNAHKRGGGAFTVQLNEDLMGTSMAAADDVLGLHEALERLRAFDPRMERVLELRYFGGLTVKETASILNVSVRTVERDQTLGRAYLSDQLTRSGEA